MRIVLLYPPPWKIQSPQAGPDGPPAGLDERMCLNGDIQHIPCGLLSLAAQVRAAGHAVTVLNLFAFGWSDIETIIRLTPADLYGLSCFTANRRGTGYLARLIRERHPGAHIAVGGPHASALPREMLERCPEIDTVIIGEGEQTLLELVAGLEQGAAASGIAGIARRTPGGVELGPLRSRIADLDRLASPVRCAADYILLTSRGCPWDCSFCASTGIWGRRHRYHSAGAVLDMLEELASHGRHLLAFKDETFTDDREQVLAVCRGIRQRGLNVLWSCDTRADRVDEELLAAMRRAGCRRISFGVESASLPILRELNKRLDLEAVAAAVRYAKRCGLQVRFYMIAGSPGETLQTLQESLTFIERVQPHQVIFNPFTYLPGTRAWRRAEQAGALSTAMLFEQDFFELTFDRLKPEQCAAGAIAAWLTKHAGLRRVCAYSVAELRRVLALFPGLPAAHYDMAAACFRAGDLRQARAHACRALELGYPAAGDIHNCLAAVAAAAGEVRGALEHLIRAKEAGPGRIVENNVELVQHWLRSGATVGRCPPQLTVADSFEIAARLEQPVLPGPVTITDAAGRPVVVNPQRF